MDTHGEDGRRLWIARTRAMRTIAEHGAQLRRQHRLPGGKGSRLRGLRPAQRLHRARPPRPPPPGKGRARRESRRIVAERSEAQRSGPGSISFRRRLRTTRRAACGPPRLLRVFAIHQGPSGSSVAGLPSIPNMASSWALRRVGLAGTSAGRLHPRPAAEVVAEVGALLVGDLLGHRSPGSSWRPRCRRTRTLCKRAGRCRRRDTRPRRRSGMGMSSSVCPHFQQLNALLMTCLRSLARCAHPKHR